jgi:hypothetical protein
MRAASKPHAHTRHTTNVPAVARTPPPRPAVYITLQRQILRPGGIPASVFAAGGASRSPSSTRRVMVYLERQIVSALAAACACAQQGKKLLRKSIRARAARISRSQRPAFGPRNRRPFPADAPPPFMRLVNPGTASETALQPVGRVLRKLVHPRSSGFLSA